VTTSRIRSLRSNVERRKGERDRLQKTIDDLTENIRRDTVHARRLERALEIVKQVGLATQKQLEYHLAEQVSLAMEAVFDDPYKLKVNFEEKRGQTEVQLLFARRDLEFPPIGSSGGGTIDVASLALRIAYWSMRRDQRPRPTLLLDEPFSQLKGEEANKRALAMLQEISHKLGIQVITVSDERVSR
jgi:DNA repair exonuclease SbcCD ATPase subunit